MDAPAGSLSPEVFDETIARHISEEYEKLENGYTCKKCGSTIKQTTGYASMHSKEFDNCTGGGEVKRFPLPYCPKCEGEPKRTQTCVHS